MAYIFGLYIAVLIILNNKVLKSQLYLTKINSKKSYDIILFRGHLKKEDIHENQKDVRSPLSRENVKGQREKI